MNFKKTILTLSTAFTMAMLTSMPVSVSAKVIEPVITHTENWTASYYIDDDKDTLYPYIEVQADIYSNGTVEVSFWNTHEWDDYANVEHKVTMPYTVPYGTDSMEYAFSQGEMYLSGNRICYPIANPPSFTVTVITNSNNTSVPVDKNTSIELKDVSPDFSLVGDLTNRYDVSYYPSGDYSCSIGEHIFGKDNYNLIPYMSVSNLSDVEKYVGKPSFPYSSCYYNYYGRKGSLAYLPVGRKSYDRISFTTSKNITKEYQFHILGHDFTVSPEMLVTEKGDVNCDGSVGVSDVVLLQKWILNSRDAKLNNWRAADLNNDEEINVYDLVLLRRKLLEVV